ncbi:exodeoxyribonuclease VII small subunit [Prochlorococcus sp. MIT 1341]|uniref:exodeoxyribonuclease VII small subunit n=1 Tax=Prochlorococcus sp. MIT 1341 TaxID=3096221 RepID=UPI002A75A925|nr:exodeoxyribonuclease VII small subunit [Prochlorococcus sp. MIT 1341]
MSKQPLNSNKNKTARIPKGKDSNSKVPTKTREDALSRLKKTIESLPYEESLTKLEVILDELKNDNMPIEEVQKSYLEAKVYLEHCETLLTKLEQSVCQLDLEGGGEEI